ncbi:MAG: fibronectin type III domain-containing protein, partial [Burkholderiales bacterium]
MQGITSFTITSSISNFLIAVDNVVLQNIGPTITSATYDASTNVLAVTGTNMTTGDTIDPTKLTLTGQGGSTYTLTSSSVTSSSATAFSITLNATDQTNVESLLNKNGTSSVGGTTYNLAAAASWDSTATAYADLTGNGVTVSNVTLPSAPTISGITPGSGQLSVAFTAGASGSSAITNYKYSTDNGSTFTAVSPSSTASPIVITGLTNGTTYSVQIKAVNANGDGTATGTTTGTPSTTPSAPTITGITPGSGQLSVAFTAGASGGSAITNYKYSIDNGSTFTAVS